MRTITEVLQVLYETRERVRIFYGKDGKMWLEEYDVMGHVSSSCGSKPIYLLVNNSRSFGGSPISEDNICRIQATKGKRVIWDNGTPLPEFDIEADGGWYRVSVKGGDAYAAAFEDERRAIRWAEFMRGERMAKG